MTPMPKVLSLLFPGVLSACAIAPDIPPPVPVQTIPLGLHQGLGSEHGTYAAQVDGEMTGPNGEHCIVFNWDRPLEGQPGSDALVFRLRSASCESPDHPGRMISVELSRSVIPISESSLGSESDEIRP